MSVPVDLDAVCQQMRGAGPAAFLVTVSDDGRPHVVSASLVVEDGHAHTRVGRHTSANLAERPDLTLLWPAEPGADYCLLVDGRMDDTPDPDGGAIRVRPTSAVWHRVADAAGSGPTCLPVEAP